MNVSELKANVRDEMRAARQELQDLKRCQLQYFTLATTSTGAILGLTAILGTNHRGLAFLAPLAVILPAWLIFFDKATTITRIAGYQRLLEKQLTADSQLFQFPGYENALSQFRKREVEAWAYIRSETPYTRPRFTDVAFLRTRHRYWMINWYTFLVLSLACALGAYNLLGTTRLTFLLPFGLEFSGPERSMFGGTALVLVMACAAYTFLVIVSLTLGGLSFDACGSKWEYILGNSADVTPNSGIEQSARPAGGRTR